MPLNTPGLKNTLRGILNDPKLQNNSDAVANALGDAIEAYVKTGTVTGTTSNGGTIITSQIN